MLTVDSPGVWTTVQDLGREGWAHLGVPRSGAADRQSHSLSNRIVGNPETAATLEVTVRGPLLRIHAPVTFAVSGAPTNVTLNGRPVTMNRATWAPANSLLDVGAVSHGIRSYVAFAGGIDERLTLGSRSTDSLSGIGPEPVRAGRELTIGHEVGAVPFMPLSLAPRASSKRCRVVLLLGPRADWISRQGLQRLRQSDFTVAPTSNRVGLRLEGATIEWQRSGEMRSEGAVPGSMQIPPSGDPIVLLADHPTTGGYPVVGVIGERDLGAIAQLSGGDVVNFDLRNPQ